MADMDALQAQLNQVMGVVESQQRELEQLRGQLAGQAAAGVPLAAPPGQANGAADLAAMFAMVAQQQAAAAQQQQELLAALARDRPRNRPTLVDQRGLGKPERFSSKEADWRIWALRLVNYVSGVYPQARRAMH